MKPAIVVVTYNRTNSLKRLLKSIEQADYKINDIPLIISIDGGARNNREIIEIAKKFKWDWGTKRIIEHQNNLGLRKHIISCGDLSDEYGSVIILEDDLFVSNQYYRFCCLATEFYRENDNIAGIGLYSYHWNVLANFPFIPIKTDYDTYFMQFPASWGQCWTKRQWRNFKNWYNLGQSMLPEDKIPESVKKWPETSWLKYFTKYVVSMNKYFVYPYFGYSTNFGDQGVHNNKLSVLYQVPLCSGLNINFQKFSEKSLRYDAYYEIHSAYIKNNCKELQDYEFEMDLFGIKKNSQIDKEYLISTKKCKHPLLQFSYKLKPHEQNILNNIMEPPFTISFGLKDNFSSKKQIFSQQDYFNSINGLKNLGKFFIKKVIMR
jgi:hypothetical protein